jgi:hypothetical protein
MRQDGEDDKWNRHRSDCEVCPNQLRAERNTLDQDRLRRRDETEEYKLDLAERNKERRMREISTRDHKRAV